jgi:hypothetical protein
MIDGVSKLASIPFTNETPSGQIRGSTGRLGIGNQFLSSTVMAQEIQTRIDKWECVK